MNIDWKQTLVTVAPTIATALGGPMAGVAVNVAAKALGLEASENAEQAIAAAVSSGDPSIMLQLKQADNDFKLELKRLGVELEKIHAGDRNSARELAKATNLKPQVILATVFVIGFIAVLYGVFSGEFQLEGPMENAAMYLLGILSAGINQILNFFFGSSSGSKEKTAEMAGRFNA